MTQKKTTSKAKPRKKKTAVGKTAAKKRAPARKTSGAKPVRSAAKKTKARKKTSGKTTSARPGFFAGIRRFVLRAVLAILLLGLPSAGAYMVWLDYQVREAFEGKRWAVPARVYAAPTALYSGMRLTPAELEVSCAVCVINRATPIGPAAICIAAIMSSTSMCVPMPTLKGVARRVVCR